MAEGSPNTGKSVFGEMLRLDFLALLSAVAVFGFSLGVSYPMLGLAMEDMGRSNAFIGLNSTMTAVGILVSSPWLPAVARRFGPGFVMSGSLLITAICFLSFGIFYDPDIWLVLRFVMGMTINGLFMLSETWVNMIANDTNRGRYIGIYATVLAGSFAAGPVMVPILGFQGMLPFLVCTTVVLAGLVPLFMARKVMPQIKHEASEGSVISYLFRVPTLMGAILLLAFVDFAAFSLMPVYAVRAGVAVEIAPYMLATLALGNVFLQVPIGWLSDTINRYTILIICGALTMVGALAVPLVIEDSWLIWPLLFFWGGIAYGLLTIAMGILGTRFSGSALVSANAATALAWGLGGIVGPSLGGYAMDLTGPHALMWVVAFGCLVFLIIAISRHPGALRGSSS
ncbi:MAG: MFS transporter [Alphaproteobacteria bacterium]|jgi:MFS family permease|nr:MFS transporter [Alphaproteobacteria bacterium]MBT4082278.1 MFS transporter [Alphaproteobacteria bacterium]MBT4542821.1 MFS transporter [Alphaproteobacteria bacterium]MBT7744199.1 MFS transporter [Alphaproteobacteria bacterium]